MPLVQLGEAGLADRHAEGREAVRVSLLTDLADPPAGGVRGGSKKQPLPGAKLIGAVGAGDLGAVHRSPGVGAAEQCDG